MNNSLMVYGILCNEHTGKENAIKSKELEEIASISGQEVRGIINELRTCGIPVCSGRTGYWLATNKSDVQETLKQLQSRVDGIQNAINGLKKASVLVPVKEEKNCNRCNGSGYLFDMMLNETPCYECTGGRLKRMQA